MPRVPPGIKRRTIYSEPLENTGVLLEKRYKEHQLEDLSRLRLQADHYLNRSINNIMTNPRHHQSNNYVTSESRVSITIPSDGNIQRRDSSSESAGNTPRDPDPNQSEVAAPLDLELSKTKVVLDVVASPRDPENPSEPGMTEGPVEALAVGGKSPSEPSTARSVEIIHIASVDESADGNIRLSLREVREEDEPVVSSKRNTISHIGRWCVATQIFISAVFISVLCIMLTIDCGQHLRTFTIIYPFVVYFVLRGVVVGFDCLFGAYTTVRRLPTSSGFYGMRGNMLKGCIKNVCIMLGVAAAVMPYGNTYGQLTTTQVNSIYLAFVAGIHIITLSATYLHFRVIGTTSKS